MASVHDYEDSTTNQAVQGGVWKVEWNAQVRENFFFEVLGGQFIAGRHERPNNTSSYRFEDRGLTVSGGNRDWETTWRRDQIVGSVMYQMTGAAGSHYIKLGGSIEGSRQRSAGIGATWTTSCTSLRTAGPPRCTSSRPLRSRWAVCNGMPHICTIRGESPIGSR